jgi:hypothetical protein
MRVVLLSIVLIISISYVCFACQRDTPISVPDMLDEADLIVHAIATKYIIAPTSYFRTSGEPESTIEFTIVEVMKGDYENDTLVLHGYLSPDDDFNDHDPPYTFVRKNGRRGSCFANTYKRSGEFLLILKFKNGQYTPDWYALGPTNEQVTDFLDAWVMWVRGYLAGRSTTGKQ